MSVVVVFKRIHLTTPLCLHSILMAPKLLMTKKKCVYCVTRMYINLFIIYKMKCNYSKKKTGIKCFFYVLNKIINRWNFLKFHYRHIILILFFSFIMEPHMTPLPTHTTLLGAATHSLSTSGVCRILKICLSKQFTTIYCKHFFFFYIYIVTNKILDSFVPR